YVVGKIAEMVTQGRSIQFRNAGKTSQQAKQVIVQVVNRIVISRIDLRCRRQNHRGLVTPGVGNCPKPGAKIIILKETNDRLVRRKKGDVAIELVQEVNRSGSVQGQEDQRNFLLKAGIGGQLGILLGRAHKRLDVLAQVAVRSKHLVQQGAKCSRRDKRCGV